jgi:leucyl/phenylalanyl-tRNA--protein transferase
VRLGFVDVHLLPHSGSHELSLVQSTRDFNVATPPDRLAPVPVFRLPMEPIFPDPAEAEPDGLLAVGGDLSPVRLLAAYSQGIFPWYSEEKPILWWSPDPRLVLLPAELHRPRSLQKTLRSGRFTIHVDTAFEQVIQRCADKPRPGQDGTWITEEMIDAYVQLHRLGFAHSFESWEEGELAGGLYGVSLGAAFFGESMFADRPDSSKVAFVRSVEWLAGKGVELIDCQITTPHLVRFGAREHPRVDFLARLARALERPSIRGRWEP